MLTHRRSNLWTQPVDEVENAFWNSRFMQDLGENQPIAKLD